VPTGLTSIFFLIRTSLEINHKSHEIVKRSQAGGGVAVKIEHAVYEPAKMFGRHFEEQDDIVSLISRESLDVLKVSFFFLIPMSPQRLRLRLKIYEVQAQFSLVSRKPLGRSCARFASCVFRCRTKALARLQKAVVSLTLFVPLMLTEPRVQVGCVEGGCSAFGAAEGAAWRTISRCFQPCYIAYNPTCAHCWNLLYWSSSVPIHVYAPARHVDVSTSSGCLNWKGVVRLNAPQ
jgi:hypothetical protein